MESRGEDMPFVTRTEGDLLIVLGRKAVAQLPEFFARMGRRRAFLVAGASVAAGRVGHRVREVLWSVLVGAYSRTQPHVPVQTVDDVVSEARRLAADVVIGLGGGSPIGTAKAAAYRLQRDGGMDCIVAAIPTTYAGSEVTAVFGTTDLERGRKDVVHAPSVRPRLALYDPDLAVDTPPDLTASTGVNALAHCVEALYSKTAGPEEREAALRGAGRLVEFLPKTRSEPRNVLYRYRLFEGSMEAGLVLATTGMGVHHGICHVLGGRFRAPHGVLNAIILPHAMRFNASIAEAAYRGLAPLLQVSDQPAAPGVLEERVCDAMAAFVKRLGVPQRLRELGIPKEDLPGIAEEALQSTSVQNNPRPVRDARDVLRILTAAW